MHPITIEVFSDLIASVGAIIAVLYIAKLLSVHKGGMLYKSFFILMLSPIFFAIGKGFDAMAATGVDTTEYHFIHSLFEVITYGVFSYGLFTLNKTWNMVGTLQMKKDYEVTGDRDILLLLGNEIRIRILLLLYDHVELSYTELLNILGIDRGLLNFHLRRMRSFLLKTANGTYVLSDYGKEICTALRRLAKGSTLIDVVPSVKSNNTLILKRCLAFIIDVLILSISTMVVFSSSLWEFIRTIFSFNVINIITYFKYENVYPYIPIFFVSYLYFTILEAYKGQTLGKFLLGLRVIKTDGTKITLTDSAVRNIGKVVLLPLDVILGIILYRKKGYIRFFDHYTGITVENVVVT